MFVAAKNQRNSLVASRSLPQTHFRYEAANARDRNRERLSGNKLGGDSRRSGQNQLEVFAVSQRVVERRKAVFLLDRQILRCDVNGNLTQVEKCAQAARFAQAGQIKGQSV